MASEMDDHILAHNMQNRLEDELRREYEAEENMHHHHHHYQNQQP